MANGRDLTADPPPPRPVQPPLPPPTRVPQPAQTRPVFNLGCLGADEESGFVSPGAHLYLLVCS